MSANGDTAKPELQTLADQTTFNIHSDQSIIEQGREVGLLARQMFPGGVAVEGRDREEAIRMTRELIANPAVPVIFEGAFEHRDVFVRVDILHRRRDQRWRLIEVKSATDVKDHHFDDVAIQHRVVTRSGVDVAASCLAHVSRDYVYEGGPIYVHRFIKIKNLTRQVEKLQPEITAQIRSEFRILAMPEAPQIHAGRQCNDPFTCEFLDHCNPPLPDDHILRHRRSTRDPNCTWLCPWRRLVQYCLAVVRRIAAACCGSRESDGTPVSSPASPTKIWRTSCLRKPPDRQHTEAHRNRSTGIPSHLRGVRQAGEVAGRRLHSDGVREHASL
jgi:hypothetical protein